MPDRIDILWSSGGDGTKSSQPLLHQRGYEVQQFDTLRLFPIGLAAEPRRVSCRLLNEILGDSMILYALYKKHHWLVRGHTFYQLHLLLDKHAEEQAELIDQLAERVQTLGGVAIADPRHVAEVTSVPARRTEPRKFPPCSRACSRRTRSSSTRSAPPSNERTPVATTAPVTSSPATCCVATSSRSGSSRNTWSTHPPCAWSTHTGSSCHGLRRHHHRRLYQSRVGERVA